ncbi:helix-turn-helix domain-containing protein [Alteromonas sp. 5E99-2]|uniref:helix-turn-helix domain-containing protein n=1 Tax=Alteromonas sp. 5E99-2 TaxID=2817683 RepID=UPI001A99ABB6|nr:helix-turn-helix domain-containing protein [Alteromonas sp. 5E99-2]MBO1256590.1 helix-turn-helix domain-containing protein [Alteromonas sp. 5E99-2]
MSMQPSTSFESWKADVCDAFCNMNLVRTGTSTQAFKGELKRNDLNHIRLCTVQCKSLCVDSANTDGIQLSGKEYLVKFQLSGNTKVEHRGRVAELTPGDFTIFYNEEPFKLEFNKLVKHAVLVIPADQMLKVCPNIDKFLGLLFDKNGATNSLLSQYVVNLTNTVNSISPDIVVRVEHILLELLGTALSAAELPDEPNTPASTDLHLKSIKKLILTNLDNPELSTDYLAKQENISKRYLHKLFANEGISVSRFIQQHRLEACKKALSSPSLANMSITDVALEWCFSDVSHFHRCFKARYQMTPRKFRMHALTQ